MKGNSHASLAALIALKLACCGALLLLVLSGVGLGALVSTVAGNGWVEIAGGSVAVLAARSR